MTVDDMTAAKDSFNQMYNDRGLAGFNADFKQFTGMHPSSINSKGLERDEYGNPAWSRYRDSD